MDPESTAPSLPAEFYVLFFQQAAEAMFVADPQGRMVAVNAQLSDILGFAAEEILGRPFQDFTGPEDPRTDSLRAAGHRAGTRVVAERQLRCKDGRLLPVELTTRILPDGHLLGVGRDITERKRAEAEAKANHLRLLSILDANADPVYVADPETYEVLYVNRALEQAFGAPEQRKCYEYLQHRSAPCPFCTNDRILGANLGRTFVWEFQNESNGRWYRCVDRAITWPDGRIVRYEMTTDLTERKQAEEALRESEGRLRTLFEGASDAIFLVEGRRFVDCNARTLEVFGCTREEILGHHPADFSPSEQRDGAPSVPLAEAWMRAALAGEPQSFEWLHHRRDGTPFDAEVSLARVEWQGRVYLQAIVRDVTERRRVGEERLEMERRLLHAQKLESLGVLAGGIAHDFNNLLMAMLGNLDLALRDLSPGSARPRLEAASNAARRAADLTRQMLAYSGRGKFVVGRLDLNELLEGNIDLLRTSVPRTTTLKLRLARALPAVEADAGQIQQVIMNLITNASEAIGGEPGTITLSTGVQDCDVSYLGRSRLEVTPPAGRYAYFEVADTGCGMDEQTQKRMFEPFFTTKFTGRGLGMSAVLGIVRGHRGAILLDSAAGAGATIRVLFPAVEVAPGAAAPVEGAPSGTAEVAPPPAGSGVILVVDDEDVVRNACVAMAESMGFTVLTAGDGEQAVEMVRRHGAGIRAIILDLTMPCLDGAAALERILCIEPGMKVILSSGYDEAEATRRVAKDRLAGFIRKPYSLEQFRNALRRALGDAP